MLFVVRGILRRIKEWRLEDTYDALCANQGLSEIRYHHVSVLDSSRFVVYRVAIIDIYRHGVNNFDKQKVLY